MDTRVVVDCSVPEGDPSRERRVPLTAQEINERAAQGEENHARLAAEGAAQVALAERRATLTADLAAVRDPAARRVLELVLLRLGVSG